MVLIAKSAARRNLPRAAPRERPPAQRLQYSGPILAFIALVVDVRRAYIRRQPRKEPNGAVTDSFQCTWAPGGRRVLLAKLRLVTQNLAGVDDVVTSDHENLPITVRGKLWR